MNIYVSFNKQCPNGYLHIDPSPKGNNVIFVGSFSEPYNICNYDEVEHIIIDNTYELIYHKQKNQIIQYWYDLLKSGGKLTIIGKDFIEICKSLLVAEISIDNLNEYIDNICSIDELDNVSNALKQVGFKIINQKLNGHEYMIEAIK